MLFSPVIDESKRKEHNCPSEETCHKTHSGDIQTYFHPILPMFDSHFRAYRATVRFCIFDRRYLSQIKSARAHQQAKHRQHHHIVGFSPSRSVSFLFVFLLSAGWCLHFFACFEHTTNVYYVANEGRDSCSEQTYASFLFISRPITFFLVFNRLIDGSLTSNRLTVLIFFSLLPPFLVFLVFWLICIDAYTYNGKKWISKLLVFSFFLLLFSSLSFSPH